MKKLTIEEWELIKVRIDTADQDIHEEFGTDVEVIWLDGTNEWALAYCYEVFEDGFKTEREAIYRLQEIEQLIS
jgi:hypothetical protein